MWQEKLIEWWMTISVSIIVFGVLPRGYVNPVRYVIFLAQSLDWHMRPAVHCPLAGPVDVGGDCINVEYKERRDYESMLAW